MNNSRQVVYANVGAMEVGDTVAFSGNPTLYVIGDIIGGGSDEVSEIHIDRHHSDISMTPAWLKDPRDFGKRGKKGKRNKDYHR